MADEKEFGKMDEEILAMMNDPNTSREEAFGLMMRLLDACLDDEETVKVELPEDWDQHAPFKKEE